MPESLQGGRIPLRELGAAQVPPALPVGVVGPGRRVTLHFALQLESGAVVDSNFGGAPVTFTVGDGNLPAGFEQALLGLGVGMRREFLLEPEQAFGAYNADNVQRFPRYRFPPDLVLSEGLMIDFSDAAENTQAGVVRRCDKRTVEVDFNHPLAGRRIRFEVQVLAVEDAEQS